MKPTSRTPLPTPRRRASRFSTVALSVCGLLAACGGGGGGGSPGSPIAKQDPAAVDLAPVGEQLSLDQQQHFLVRTSFGVNLKELERLQQIGLSAYVDELLDFKVNTAIELAAEKEFKDPSSPKDYELVHWWLRLMVRTQNPLQESLAFMWHDHFAANQNILDPGGKHLFKEHIQLFRRKGAGNVRDLFLSIMTDPTILIWLDSISNTKEQPNENLGREFFELFALGVDNGYTQEDIQEAARALTGYRLVTDHKTHKQFVIFDKSRFDAGNKTVFGVTGNFGTADIVNMTIDLRPVAEWVCKRVFEHFCYENAPPSVINQLAGMLRQNNHELKPVLRTILRSRAFFSKTSRKGRIKAPLEYVAGFVRSTGMELEFDDMSEKLSSLAQQPTRPPNVSGWPTGNEWLSPQALLERGNSINRVITSRDHQFKLGYGLNEILPARGDRTAENVVDRFLLLLRINASESERNKYVSYLNTKVKSEKNNSYSTEEDAFDPSNPTHMDERVRGLLFVLSQHPSYYLR